MQKDIIKENLTLKIIHTKIDPINEKNKQYIFKYSKVTNYNIWTLKKYFQ